MNPNEARISVSAKFPFHNYMDGAVDSYVNIAKTVQKYLNPGDRILDFGAGPGDKTAVLQTLGFKCSAFDDLSDDWHKLDNNREKIMEFASDMGIDFRVASDGHLPFVKESFEMVMLHDVLEHLHDSPRELLNDLIELIKPNGLLFITVPNAANIRKRVSVVLGKTNLPSFDTYYWYQGSWRGHVREYVRDDLKTLAENLGLEIMELRSCHHMLGALSPKIRPLFVLFSYLFPGWRDTWLLVLKKPKGWKAMRRLSETEYAAIMGKVCPYSY